MLARAAWVATGSKAASIFAAVSRFGSSIKCPYVDL